MLCKVSGLDMPVSLTADPWLTEVNETMQMLMGPVVIPMTVLFY